MRGKCWFLAAFSVVSLMGGTCYFILTGSCPKLSGTIKLEGLLHPTVIVRDQYSIPTIHGESRLDVARATGFLHAQERFFQMDLMRRRSAGELSDRKLPLFMGEYRATLQ